MSAQEKREEALQQMGVDELDIVEDIVPSQPLQVSSTRKGKSGTEGPAQFEPNASIRRIQNGGGGGGIQQQANAPTMVE